MPEKNKTADEAVETAKTNSADKGEVAESKSIADEVAETIATSKDKATKETETSEPLAEPEAGKTPDEGEPPADKEKTDESETLKEKEEEASLEDPSSFLEDVTEKKSGLEKRIDKLTALNYQKDAKIAELQARLEEREKLLPDGKLKKRYTPDQLAKAMMKAYEDGDEALMGEILKQQEAQIKEDLRLEYEKEKKAQEEAAKQARVEWTQVVRDWEYLADPNEPELYPGSHKELDIRNNMSLLRQVALLLYNSEQEELFQRYHRPGGQALAVQDAFRVILKKRRGIKSSDTSALKNRLTKERRRKSLSGTGKHIKTEKTTKEPKRPMTPAERVLDYVNERKSFKAKAMGLA